MQNSNHNKNKIIFLTPTMAIGGVQKIFLNLANSLCNNFLVSILIARKNEDITSYDKFNKKINVVNINSSRLRYSLFNINRYIYRQKPDSIIVASPIFIFMICIINFFYKKKIKIFLTIHNDLVFLFDRLGNVSLFLHLIYLKYALYFSHKVIFPSYKGRNFLRSKFPHRWNDIITIPNPVFSKFDNYLYSDFKEDNVKIITCIGRLSTEKNYQLAIDSFNIVSKNTNALLNIVGEGPELLNLKKLTKEYGLVNKIFFLGPSLNPTNIIINSDIILSTSYEESFGNVVLEALSNNVPIVSTNTNGPTEILEYIDPNLITQDNSPATISSCILKALDIYKPNSLNKMNLRKKVENYSQDILIDKYIDILNEN